MTRYDDAAPGDADHAGHVPSSGGTVSVASIDAPYYQRHLVAVGRLLT